MVRQTRGKTKPNRHSLWLTWFAEQYHQREPFRDRSIIDLGYGEKPYSVLELYEASRGFESPPSIIGVESAAHRHQQALAERHTEISFILDENVDFSRYRSPPKLIRALNVLRQYPPQRLLRYVETGSQPVQEMFFLPKERRIEMVIRSPCGARATRLHRRWSSESPEGVDLPPIS